MIELLTQNNDRSGWVDQIPGAVSTGYQAQNTLLESLIMGHDDSYIVTKNGNVVTLKVSGIISDFGVPFVVKTDEDITIPGSYGGYFLYLYPVWPGGDRSQTPLAREVRVTTNSPLWLPAQNCYAVTDGGRQCRVLNWLVTRSSRGLNAIKLNQINAAQTEWVFFESEQWRCPVAGRYLLMLISGAGAGGGGGGGGRSSNQSNRNGAQGSIGQNGKLPQVSSITANSITSITILGGNGGKGGLGGVGGQNFGGNGGNGGAGGNLAISRHTLQVSIGAVYNVAIDSAVGASEGSDGSNGRDADSFSSYGGRSHVSGSLGGPGGRAGGNGGNGGAGRITPGGGGSEVGSGGGGGGGGAGAVWGWATSGQPGYALVKYIGQ